MLSYLSFIDSSQHGQYYHLVMVLGELGKSRYILTFVFFDLITFISIVSHMLLCGATKTQHIALAMVN